MKTIYVPPGVNFPFINLELSFDYSEHKNIVANTIMQSFNIPVTLVKPMPHQQQKLDKEAIKCMRKALSAITSIYTWGALPEGDDYWREVHNKLVDKADYGTTDGKPYNPPLEVGDYVATSDYEDSEMNSLSKSVDKIRAILDDGHECNYVVDDVVMKYAQRATKAQLKYHNIEVPEDQLHRYDD